MKKRNRSYYQSKLRISVFNQQDSYEEIFEKLVKGKCDKIKELTYEINHNDLTYYFKRNTATKRFDDFNNNIELFKEIQSAEMKLEEEKNSRIYLNQI